MTGWATCCRSDGGTLKSAKMIMVYYILSDCCKFNGNIMLLSGLYIPQFGCDSPVKLGKKISKSVEDLVLLKNTSLGDRFLEKEHASANIFQRKGLELWWELWSRPWGTSTSTWADRPFASIQVRKQHCFLSSNTFQYFIFSFPSFSTHLLTSKGEESWACPKAFAIPTPFRRKSGIPNGSGCFAAGRKGKGALDTLAAAWDFCWFSRIDGGPLCGYIGVSTGLICIDLVPNVYIKKGGKWFNLKPLCRSTQSTQSKPPSIMTTGNERGMTRAFTQNENEMKRNLGPILNQWKSHLLLVLFAMLVLQHSKHAPGT